MTVRAGGGAIDPVFRTDATDLVVVEAPLVLSEVDDHFRFNPVARRKIIQSYFY